MKTLTVNRGAAFACAFTFACTLTVSIAALAAAPSAALAAASTSAGRGLSTFENKPVHLSSGTHHVSTGAGGSLVRTIVGLAIVVAVIYGLYWIMKQARTSKTAASGDGLEQVATLPVGTGKSVTLVRVGGELHLLGIAEHAISPLRIFTEEEAYELGLPMEGDTPASAADGRPPIERLVDSFRRFTSR